MCIKNRLVEYELLRHHAPPRKFIIDGLWFMERWSKCSSPEELWSLETDENLRFVDYVYKWDLIRLGGVL